MRNRINILKDAFRCQKSARSLRPKVKFHLLKLDRAFKDLENCSHVVYKPGSLFESVPLQFFSQAPSLKEDRERPRESGSISAQNALYLSSPFFPLLLFEARKESQSAEKKNEKNTNEDALLRRV